MNNYDWYSDKDLSEYSGKWIAIINQKVVASNDDLDKLTSEVSEICSLNMISFVKVPNKSEALIYKC